ncbi:hypothetical protein AURDEDRAFT_121795 [Auricularia subglabra TFB-10046 SS5]|nr:hypothetical protein AURDEDRAFT_121795 [Auricularia subglabra TFB-10046 SS5]
MTTSPTPASAALQRYPPTLSMSAPPSAPVDASRKPQQATVALIHPRVAQLLPAHASSGDGARFKVERELRSRKALAMKQHLALRISATRSPVDTHIQRRRTGMTAVLPKRHAALARSKRPLSSSHSKTIYATHTDIPPQNVVCDGPVDDVSALLANFSC